MAANFLHKNNRRAKKQITRAEFDALAAAHQTELAYHFKGSCIHENIVNVEGTEIGFSSNSVHSGLDTTYWLWSHPGRAIRK